MRRQVVKPARSGYNLDYQGRKKKKQYSGKKRKAISNRRKTYIKVEKYDKYIRNKIPLEDTS